MNLEARTCAQAGTGPPPPRLHGAPNPDRIGKTDCGSQQTWISEGGGYKRISVLRPYSKASSMLSPTLTGPTALATKSSGPVTIGSPERESLALT